MELESINRMYFIGIGGIGMSALARYFHQRGVEIQGYDRTETALTKKLVSEGMQIHYEDLPESLPDRIDLVVFTPAVPADHQELNRFRELGVPILKRAEVLGLISRNTRTLAIAGTHGKTTTSSILTYLLHEAGISCTAFLGGIATNFQSNYVAGSGEWVVVEADEFDRSFLQLSPEMAVILSTDADHLDIYGDHGKMQEEGFRAFAGKVQAGGRLFVKEEVKAQFADFPGVQTFGIEHGDFRAERIRVEAGFFCFDFQGPDTRVTDLKLGLPGRHNVENAVAALSLALAVGADWPALRSGLASFSGIKRRFERIYSDEKRVFIDDYAHHPSELKAAIGAAKELYPGRKLLGVFQPHLYSRTRDFQDGFAEALDQLDEIILLDIYPAREKPIPGISSDVIFEKMKNPNKQQCRKADLPALLQVNASWEVLITLGAGDIDTLVEPIRQWLEAGQD